MARRPRDVRHSEAARFVGSGAIPATPKVSLVLRLPQGIVGQPYVSAAATSGGSGAKTFALTGSLPSGLSFSTSTGAITGTPTAVGTTSGLSVSVTDTTGTTTLTDLRIVVAAAPVTVPASGPLQVSGGQMDGPLSLKPAVALSDAASIATNAALGNIFSVTLAGNRTLANPTNLVAGTSYLWRITQDGTGSRTLAYGSAFKFTGGTAPTLSTAANAVDILSAVSDGTNVYAVLTKDFR